VDKSDEIAKKTDFLSMKKTDTIEKAMKK